MQRPIHPLTGADLRTLRGLLATRGAPAARHWPATAGMLASAAARAPFSAVERVITARAVRREPPAAPVVVVGHWRSGTTHLFNLLAAAGEMAHATPVAVGLPHDLRGLARPLDPLLRRAIPARRGIDPMTVGPLAPQEDEIALAAMGAPSYYHGIYFPRDIERAMRTGVFFDECGEGDRARWRDALRTFTAKMSLAGGHRRVLIKNPAHTARLREILHLWPDVQIVHIVREPCAVHHSTQRMFTDLLGMLALQDHDSAAVDRVVNETYPRMMAAAARDLSGLPAHRAVTVSFEHLTARPLEVIAHIARRLQLPNRRALLDGAASHLQRVASYSSRTHTIPVGTRTAVERHWRAQAAYWGYESPAVPAEVI